MTPTLAGRGADTTDGVLDTVGLSGGRTLTVRTVTPADVAGLDAVVSGREERLVAEAGYARLPDGNGEFALTIASGWRGWLGPYLLDALVAAAAARGVPNLQADILLTNVRMLALVKQRGYVTLRRQGPEVRVAIDAAQSRPAAGRP